VKSLKQRLIDRLEADKARNCSSSEDEFALRYLYGRGSGPLPFWLRRKAQELGIE
jgi:hypothetical protein